MPVTPMTVECPRCKAAAIVLDEVYESKRSARCHACGTEFGQYALEEYARQQADLRFGRTPSTSDGTLSAGPGKRALVLMWLGVGLLLAVLIAALMFFAEKR